MPENFHQFSYYFNTTAFASGIFHCLRHRNEFVNKTVVSQRIHPFFSEHDLGEVCVQLPLALVSCFRRHQQYKRIFVLSFSVLRWILPLLFIGILQGIAASIGTSNFLRAAFIASLNSFIVWFSKACSSQIVWRCRALVSP